jgi:hypothetical protein
MLTVPHCIARPPMTDGEDRACWKHRPDRVPLVSAADRARLEAIVADRNRTQKHVARARIILASADRAVVAEVASRAGVGRPAGGYQVIE